MMNFFRRNQKIFLLTIAIISMISFTFFGTYNTPGSNEKELPNRPLVKDLKGKWIHEQDVKGLAALLEQSNGLSSGFLEKEIFETELAPVLGERYFANCKRDFQARLKKVKNYKAYAHPQASFLNADSAWNYFAPEIPSALAQLQAQSEYADVDNFLLLIKLYQLQSAFPAEMLKRVLFYQQSQISWLAQDNTLAREDLSLFRFKTAEDWFGDQFMYLVSEFILNSAAYAEQKGYRVTKEEAFAHLLQNVHQSLQTEDNKETSSQETHQYLVASLHHQGLTEAQGVELWRKALLFQRLFHDIGSSFLLDGLVQREFQAFASEKALLNIYHLPEEFRFKNFEAFLKFQTYLEAVAPKTRDLTLPTTCYSVDEIEKKYPELVQRSFSLELLHVNKAELIPQVSLKEAWDWELEEANWEILQREFPVLAKSKILNPEGRFALLEQLEPRERIKVDRFAQGKIVDLHPEWIEAAFEKQTPVQEKVGIRLEEHGVSLEGIEDGEIFLALLEDAPLKSERAKPYHGLNVFTQDKEHYYRIWVLEKPTQREVLTFKLADQLGILNRLLDKRLETAYSDIRRKEPTLFQKADGSWKPLHEMKEQVKQRVFSEVQKSLDEMYGKNKSSAADFDFYARYRFHPELTKCLQGLRSNPSNETENTEVIASQWKLLSKESEGKRKRYPEAFEMLPGHFSEVTMDHQGLQFYQLLGRQVDTQAVQSQVKEHQSLLAHEARLALMDELLEVITQKNALDLSVLIKDTHGQNAL